MRGRRIRASSTIKRRSRPVMTERPASLWRRDSSLPPPPTPFAVQITSPGTAASDKPRCVYRNTAVPAGSLFLLEPVERPGIHNVHNYSRLLYITTPRRSKFALSNLRWRKGGGLDSRRRREVATRGFPTREDKSLALARNY